jgi:flavin-dependent dehydrogenase
MAANHYDVIVVGARCAGSPTAMLLARQGYRVLLADRATFPSDTISTHVIHPTGIAALNRWGLLGQLDVAGWPYAEFAANKTDIEGNYLKNFDLAPDFAERIPAANRETRIVGTTVPNYFRQPYGPGWALAGDAGYSKDPITAQDISDAFRDAELCATALDQALSGTLSFGEAMSRYQTARDEHALPMYEFTTQLATLQPPEELRATSSPPFTATKRPWTASHGPAQA